MNIDKIMDMLEWNNSHKIQEKGIKNASKVKHLDIFIMPNHKNNGKSVWENCAKILYKKTDEELKPYIYKILYWIQDYNWPGAFIIYDRLKNYINKEEILLNINLALKDAKKIEDTTAINNLNELKNDILKNDN